MATTQTAARAEPVDLITRFNTYFRAASADTLRLIETAFALRYQVYCLERNFEEPAHYQDCLEQDEFDRRAVHSLVYFRPRQEAIGTVRLILPDARPDSLPIQKFLRQNGIDATRYFSTTETAEISRFAISKDFRRRNCDGQRAHAAESDRRSNLPCLGLIQNLVRQSVDMGITTWAAVMEPQLIRMLSLMGIRFTPIGPMVSHRGLRQPAMCDVPRMLKNLEQEKPDFWAIVTNNGELFFPTKATAARLCVA